MGKGKKNHTSQRDLKAQKRNARRNTALNTLLNNQSSVKYKSQNFSTPKLISQKQKIIDELNRKQKTGARQQLIDNLILIHLINLVRFPYLFSEFDFYVDFDDLY